MQNLKGIFFLFFFAAALQGCIGFGMPQPFQHKPYTLLKGGDQFGRDQLANRLLVAEAMLPITGMNGNEVLSILGQPQTINVTERSISEDWYFVYYRLYKMWPKTPEGSFLVRFYHGKVIDVLKVHP